MKLETPLPLTINDWCAVRRANEDRDDVWRSVKTAVQDTRTPCGAGEGGSSG